MLPHQRKQLIQDYLEGKDVLSVPDAVRLLRVSPATVRRDFASLAKEKVLRQVRGGVASVNGTRVPEIPPFALRAVQHHHEKSAIAARAAKLLRPEDTVMVEGGTTTIMLHEFVPQTPLRIITNSVRLAALIDEKNSHYSGLDVYLTGGMLYARTGLLMGGTALASLRQYHANWVFLSTGGITEAGVSTTNELVMEVARTMVESAEKVAVLADFSKLGKKAMCHVCRLEDVDVLITNPCPEQQILLSNIRSRGVEVIEVEPQ